MRGKSAGDIRGRIGGPLFSSVGAGAGSAYVATR